MCFILDLLPKYVLKKCFFDSFSRNTELCAFPITSPLCFDVIYPETFLLSSLISSLRSFLNICCPLLFQQLYSII